MSSIGNLKTFDAVFLDFIPGTWLYNVRQEGRFRLLEAQLIRAELHNQLSRSDLVQGCKVTCQIGPGSSPAQIIGIYVGGKWLWPKDHSVGAPKHTRSWQGSNGRVSTGRNIRNHV